jgi:hypothetical protein
MYEKKLDNLRNKIDEMILRYNKDYNIYPWDINNGLCDEFARKVISELSMDSAELFEIEFLNITDTADDDWCGFYLPCVDDFNLKDTMGHSEDDFMEILKKYADTTHMWIVFKTNQGCLHFDAETPQGVDTPFKLKTFQKFFNASKLSITDDTIHDFLKNHKKESIHISKKIYGLK